MSRTAGSSGPKTLAAIREAGLDLIHAHGYEAMSLRGLAARVGLQPGSLYNHIRTKQELLFVLIHDHMTALHREVEAALAGIADPRAQLEAFTAFHLTYHIERKREVFIGSSEIRSLEPENRATIVALRQAYENRLCAILEEGSRQGLFAIGDVRVTAYAILAMLTGICTWYEPKGRIGRAELIDIHTRLVLDGVGRR
ncbi:MAG: TetR/AcrR family transcriptional regulator [Parvibaculum sp.]|uniref:TetR/AcrR family transcriptional regulator n=1 Tax=Parvibaculum sp. TaxID=2024848 RepID=UPI0032EB7FB6